MLLAGQASRVICKLVIKVACTEVAVTKANVYVILAGEEKVAKCVCATMFVMLMESVIHMANANATKDGPEVHVRPLFARPIVLGMAHALRSTFVSATMVMNLLIVRKKYVKSVAVGMFVITTVYVIMVNACVSQAGLERVAKCMNVHQLRIGLE